jgi:hypothetical protein
MTELNDPDRRRLEHRALIAGSTVLALTSVHHVYGAIRYQTPERYYAAIVGATALVAMPRALSISRTRASEATGRAAWWVFWGVNAMVAVLLIGTFEGFYNHLVKVALYFSGASAALMRTLFPTPIYEMPNDAFFEVTGVLQVLPAGAAAYYLAKLLSYRPRRTPGPVTEPFAAQEHR